MPPPPFQPILSIQWPVVWSLQGRGLFKSADLCTILAQKNENFMSLHAFAYGAAASNNNNTITSSSTCGPFSVPMLISCEAADLISFSRNKIKDIVAQLEPFSLYNKEIGEMAKNNWYSKLSCLYCGSLQTGFHPVWYSILRYCCKKYFSSVQHRYIIFSLTITYFRARH